MKSKDNKIEFKKMKLKKLIKKLKENHISFMISRTKNGYNTLIIDSKIKLKHIDAKPEISNCVYVLNYYNENLIRYIVKVKSFQNAIIEFISEYNIFDIIKIHSGDYQLVDNVYNINNVENREVKKYLERNNNVTNKARIGFI